MRFGTCQLGRKTSACVLIGETVYDLAQAYFRTFKRPSRFRDLLEFLESDGPAKLPEVDFGRLKEDRTVSMPRREARLRAPILRPPKIVCVGLNYRDHAAEQKKEPPAAPLLFAKAPNVVIGDGDAICIPRGISEKVDHEVELGVIIGKTAWRVKRDAALDHVFAYTVFNDVTARDLQAGDKQWFRAKSLATFAPMGPVAVSAADVKPQELDLELRVNGEVRQRGSTRDMIFDVAQLIEYISSCFPLEPGDVIATGTPAGVGVFRNPPVFLQPGDEVVATIGGIGSLRNPVE